MPPVVLNLLARQGTRRTNGQIKRGLYDYMEHKNVHKFCQVVDQGWERGSVSPTHEKDL